MQDIFKRCTKPCDAVCIFVNDNASRPVIEQLHRMNIRLILLRCAGFNNVDLKAAREYGITVLRVPAYSPYAVAEHAMEPLSKLRGCDVHSSVILSSVDEKIFKRLGVNLTCEPRYNG